MRSLNSHSFSNHPEHLSYDVCHKTLALQDVAAEMMRQRSEKVKIPQRVKECAGRHTPVALGSHRRSMLHTSGAREEQSWPSAVARPAALVCSQRGSLPVCQEAACRPQQRAEDGGGRTQTPLPPLCGSGCSLRHALRDQSAVRAGDCFPENAYFLDPGKVL